MASIVGPCLTLGEVRITVRHPPECRSEADFTLRRRSVRVLVSPCVYQINHLGDQWQIISTEAGRLLPVLSVLVQSMDLDVVADSVDGFVCPNRPLHGSEANDHETPLNISDHKRLLAFICGFFLTQSVP